MKRWALISGLHGDLELYEQIQNDLKHQRSIDSLFVLGDLIGPDRNCDALLDRIRNPKRSDIKPDCVYGWWEEQLLAECGYRGDRRAQALRMSDGEEAVNQLMNAVDSSHVPWLASLKFGFIELDCALIHASSADIGDKLTPETSPLILLDRLTRLDVNRLFTAKGGQQFRVKLTGGTIQSHIKDHEGMQKANHAVPKRSVIGIGQQTAYTLYDPATDLVEFMEAGGKAPTSKRQGLGFA
ncbi:phosphoesterase [Synechococcus sp. MIT S1220]|uniref:phosphoesterase n=1 Tax=Synechococcus sp. MIT S1220 TaxID=3082549 RepID=UPI0039B01C64